MRLRNVLLPALIGMGLLCPSSQAGLTIVLKNKPGDHKDVSFAKGAFGPSILGQIDGSSVGLVFTSQQNLAALAGNQPRLGASDGTKQVQLKDVLITIPGGSYTGLIFDSTAGQFGAAKGRRLDIIVTTNLGKVYESFVGVGENFVTIAASGGERILSTRLSYKDPGGFADLRKIQVSGAVAAVPEPGFVTLAATGLGALAVGGLRRLRRNSEQAA